MQMLYVFLMQAISLTHSSLSTACSFLRTYFCNKSRSRSSSILRTLAPSSDPEKNLIFESGDDLSVASQVFSRSTENDEDRKL